MRNTSVPGKRAFSSSSTFWVPTPTCFMAPPQLSQLSQARWEWPQ